MKSRNLILYFQLPQIDPKILDRLSRVRDLKDVVREFNPKGYSIRMEKVFKKVTSGQVGPSGPCSTSVGEPGTPGIPGRPGAPTSKGSSGKSSTLSRPLLLIIIKSKINVLIFLTLQTLWCRMKLRRGSCYEAALQ